MGCKQLDYIDGNVSQYDSNKFLFERLVTEVGILNTDDGYRPDETKRHRTIACRPQAGKDHNRTGSRKSQS